MADSFKIDTIFRAVDRFTGPARRMMTGVRTYTRHAEQSVKRLQRQTQKMSDGMTGAATKIAGVGAAMAYAMQRAVAPGIGFEKELVAAAVKMPGAIRPGMLAFEALSDKAKEVGANTEFTASQAASGLKFLAAAGFDAQQSIAALPGLVDLATAAETDLAVASDIATDSLGAWGLMVQDATQLGANLARVNDVIAATAASSNTTIEQMFETTKMAGAIATQSGASIETFAALLGTMANDGTKASVAGTALKNMFVRLAAPPAEAAKALKKLGVVTKTANGDLRDIIDVLEDIDVAMGDAGTAEKAEYVSKIFGLRSIAGAQSLLKKGAAGLRQYRDQLERAEGAASEMASTMRNTTQGSINSLMSAIEGVSIQMFSMQQGSLKETIDRFTEWTRANKDLIATNLSDFLGGIIENLDNIILGLKIFAGLTVGIWAVNFALKAVAAATAVVNAVMAASPWFWVAAAVVGVGYAVYKLIQHFGGIQKTMSDVHGWIVGGWSSISDGVRSALFGVGQWVDALIGGWVQQIRDLVGSFQSVRDFASSIGGRVGALFGFESDTPEPVVAPRPVTPTERQITSRQEFDGRLRIRDDTGRAEIEETSGSGLGLTLEPTGAF